MTAMRESPMGGPGLRAGLAGYMLRRLVGTKLHIGSLVITTPSGVRVANPGMAPGPAAEIVLHRWRALRRLLFGGDLGFSEAYLDGDWDSPDISAFIELAALNYEVTEAQSDGTVWSRMVGRLRHAARRNTRRGARRNIEAHYDLGNDFYAAWLDSGMSYSSGLYTDNDMTLEAAQAQKQARVLALLKARAGQHVLEIGCGWGGLAACASRA
jgi:cyclopropane-fatty-acyl-phospholipid synthase